MPDEPERFTLPIDPMTIRAALDRVDAMFAALAERYGAEATSWPMAEASRASVMYRGVELSLQINARAIIDEYRRLESRLSPLPPPPLDPGDEWKAGPPPDDPAE